MGSAMLRFRVFVVAAFVFCAFGASFLGAQARVALVIGNANYKGMTPLKNSTNDARDVGAALKDLGFSVEVLLDADLASMENGLVKFSQKLASNPGTYGFFFYAGHGVQSSDGNNYLIPADASIPAEAFLKSKAMALQTVLDVLQDSKNGLNMIVLDACRDNPFAWSRSASRGLAVVRGQPSGSIIAYATSAGSVAQDGTERNGLYTSVLLKNLKTPGLEIKDVFNITGKGVRDASGGAQIPAVYNQFFDSAWLAGQPTPPPSASPVVQIVQGKAGNPLPQRPAGTLIAADFEGSQTEGWIPRAFDEPRETVIAVKDVSHSGTGSLKVTKRNFTWSGFRKTILEKPEPGLWYRYSAWVMMPGGARTTALSVTIEYLPLQNGRGIEYRSAGVRFANRGEWVHLSGVFQVPPGLAASRADLCFETFLKEPKDALPEDLADFHIDEFTFEALPAGAKLKPFQFSQGFLTLTKDSRLHAQPVLVDGKPAKNLRLNWVSSDPSILMVTPQGMVMPLQKGQVILMAESEEGLSTFSWVTVVDTADLKFLRGFKFDSPGEADKLVYEKSADWTKNPAKFSNGSARLTVLSDAGDQGKGDGALKVEFQNEDLGFLDAGILFKKLPETLPKGTVINLKMKSMIDGLNLTAGLLSGSPDWKWFGDESPDVPLVKDEWTEIHWQLPQAVRLKADGVLKFIVRSPAGTAPVKGSFLIDDFEILVP